MGKSKRRRGDDSDDECEGEDSWRFLDEPESAEHVLRASACELATRQNK